MKKKALLSVVGNLCAVFLFGACTQGKIPKDENNKGDKGCAYIRIDESGNENSTGEYILFGSYPQSEVMETTLIATLEKKTGALPTESSVGLWNDYGYYRAGSKSRYMWYIDVEEDGEKYRGVYFDEYRLNNPTYTAGADYSHQDDNGYFVGDVYWFLYEPIRWKVLSEEVGGAVLFCEGIIDSQAYQNVSTYDSGSKKWVTNSNGAPSGTYSNNYKYSTIRSWLNSTFYKTAFNDLQQSIIQESGVMNSGCENTQDKVYLLSSDEAISYFNTAGERQKKSTAYAQCQGCIKSTEGSYYGNGYWWLRSPSSWNESACSYDVDPRGNFYKQSFSVSRTDCGVAPALKIKL